MAALALLLLLQFHLSDSIHGGFTTQLIPRDSPLSPSHKPNATHFERMRGAFQRSFVRVSHRFRRSKLAQPTTRQGGLVLRGGEYYLNISIGTPAIPFIGIVDTGSDLTWLQCKPCVQCYKQIPPLFDPTLSSSYRPIQCSTNDCRALESAGCGKDHVICSYNFTYADSSFTSGNLAFETFTVGSASGHQLHLQNVEFGCGNNDNAFDSFGSGLVGLGGGKLSLVTQLKKNNIPAKFSYCLGFNDSSGAASKINFGRTATVSGTGVVSTPLVTKDSATPYYITLEGVSVGNMRVESKFASSVTKNNDMVGNMFIDSGTSLTYVPSHLYQAIVAAVEKVFVAQRVKDPDGIMNLCWKTESNKDFPLITFHFTGADVELERKNTVSFVAPTVLCFTIEVNSYTDGAIFGNMAQADYLVGYDLDNRSLSFKADCSKAM